jgi:DNA repair ATPase RecN
MSEIDNQISKIIVDRDSAQETIARKCDELEAAISKIEGSALNEAEKKQQSGQLKALLETQKALYVQMAQLAFDGLNKLEAVKQMVADLAKINAKLKSEQDALTGLAKTITTIGDVMGKIDSISQGLIALAALV